MGCVFNNLDFVKETSFKGMTTTPVRTRRPFGVYAIITLLALRAFVVYLDLVRVRMDLIPVVLPPLHNETTLTVLVGAILLVVAVIIIGLFLLQRWAWVAAMILIGANLLSAIIDYLNGGDPFMVMLLDVVSVFYLNQQGVQAAFERRPAAGEMAR